MIHASNVTPRRFEMVNRRAEAKLHGIAGRQHPDAVVRLFPLVNKVAIAAKAQEHVAAQRMRGADEGVGHVVVVAVGRHLMARRITVDVDVRNRNGTDIGPLEPGHGARHDAALGQERVIVNRDDDVGVRGGDAFITARDEAARFSGG